MILDLFPCLHLAIGPLLTTGHYIRGFSGVRVTQIFSFRCVVVSIIGWACPFPFDHCIIFPSSTYVFWLALLHLQTFQLFININFSIS